MRATRVLCIGSEVIVWISIVIFFIARYYNAPAHVKNTRILAAASSFNATNSVDANLVNNGRFRCDYEHWSLWNESRTLTASVSIVSIGDTPARNALRVENPWGRFVGVQQVVRVTSGVVYRLTGSARSVATNASQVIFGGRIGFFVPPSFEEYLLWTSEYNEWWRKSMLITNRYDGIAVVYISMGYGSVGSTGEFTDVRLEEVW